MSTFYFLFILGMCVFYSVWLSLEFSVKSKFHIFWTIPVGFFGCFVALAIFALIVGQTDDVSFVVAASAVFLPFPIWRLFKQQNKQVLPTSASRPKETAAPSPLFNIHKNVKSNIEQQKVLIQKDKGEEFPSAEVSGSKDISPNLPDFDDNHNVGPKQKSTLPDGLKFGDTICFFYASAKDESSDCRVVLRGFDGIYLSGWDLSKHGEQKFRIDQISGGIVNRSTGEVFYL